MQLPNPISDSISAFQGQRNVR